jgi:hypothetical protein
MAIGGHSQRMGICPHTRGYKNRKAHEATREVAAWADGVCAPRGANTPLRHRTDFRGNQLPAWARLDPFSAILTVACLIAQTVGRDTLCRDRSPNRAAWRFPDWTVVGFRYRGITLCHDGFRRPKGAIANAVPSPFLGSRSAYRSVSRTSRPLGLICRWSQDSLPRDGRSLAAMLTQIARAFSRPLVLGGLIAGRRLPPCPPSIASHGFSAWRKSVSVSGAFSIFAGHFRARRRREIYRVQSKSRRDFVNSNSAYPHPNVNP